MKKSNSNTKIKSACVAAITGNFSIIKDLAVQKEKEKIAVFVAKNAHCFALKNTDCRN